MEMKQIYIIFIVALIGVMAFLAWDIYSMSQCGRLLDYIGNVSICEMCDMVRNIGIIG